jgi:acyl carrier protein
VTGEADVRQRIRGFIHENFYAAQGVGDDESLLDGGLLDSTGVLELVAFLEAEFGLRMADDEIVPGNLETIDRMCAYVERKRLPSAEGAALAAG